MAERRNQFTESDLSPILSPESMFILKLAVWPLESFYDMYLKEPPQFCVEIAYQVKVRSKVKHSDFLGFALRMTLELH